MNALEFIGIAVIVTISMATVEFAHARCQRALRNAWDGVTGARHQASRWNVACWAAASVGFYFTVRYSMALLPFEALGLYIGTWAGAHKHVD